MALFKYLSQHVDQPLASKENTLLTATYITAYPPDRSIEQSKGDGAGNFMNKVKTQINRLADRLPDFLDDKDQPVRSLGPSDSHR